MKQSIEFSERSSFKDAAGNARVGETLDASLVTNLKHNYAEIQAGNDVNKSSFQPELYKQFAEATVRHL